MTPIPFLSLKDLHTPIREELYERVRRVIDSGVYLNGPETAAFARELASLVGTEYAVPVSNGLDAIRLILKSYMEMGKLRPGDEVIVPANTYIATVLPVVELGLKPVLVSPDLTTYGLNWEEAYDAIRSRTKAVITVHLYGTPSWSVEVTNEMRARGLLIIEDNAQAIGATFRDPYEETSYFTGKLGDAAAFSFYPTKNIGALGDAGAVTTDDPELAATVKAIANYGSTERYHNDYCGFNCRMDEIQAAILRFKLQHLEEETERRIRNARLYDSLTDNSEVEKPLFLPDRRQVWHQYVVRTPRRDEMRRLMAEAGIATDVHYPLSLFDQKCFAPGILDSYRNARKDAAFLAEAVMSLPIATVSEEEISTIAKTLNRL